MKRKGFSPTTIVLMLVLFVPVLLISQKVTQPPPGPPTVTKADPVRDTMPTPSKEEIKRRTTQMQAKRKQMENDYKKGMAIKNGPKIPTAFNPNQMDITPDYFHQNSDGEAGIQRLRQKVAAATAAMKSSPGTKSSPVKKDSQMERPAN